MNRREFTGGLAGAAAWPIAGRAQQVAMPVIGLLHPATLGSTRDLVTAFRRGLAETG
jgi:putative tryptophan/tyrosine transport system substrate-binding protein